jgi:formate hydrogenlyase subunit 3/multisubunit Na+/H+ antiporter MnhD subunit
MEDKKPISHIVAGLIIAAILVVYSILLQFMGLSQNQSMGWISYIILLGGIIVFVNLYGKAKDHQVTFGNLFSYGFKATAIITLIMVLFIIIFFMAFPDFKEKIVESAREGMEQQGKMTDDQIDQGLEMFEKNFILFSAGGALFMYLLLGAIASLIGAAITKKQPRSPFEQQPL